jgi:hypothetical protein
MHVSETFQHHFTHHAFHTHHVTDSTKTLSSVTTAQPNMQRLK